VVVATSEMAVKETRVCLKGAHGLAGGTDLIDARRVARRVRVEAFSRHQMATSPRRRDSQKLAGRFRRLFLVPSAATCRAKTL
jgi:hypothetical protein